jgi:hypothetical protein
MNYGGVYGAGLFINSVTKLKGKQYRRNFTDGLREKGGAG